MATRNDSAMRQQVEHTRLDLGNLAESVEIVVDWVVNMLEKHALEEIHRDPALENVALGERQDMEVDITIRDILPFLVLAERVIDHQTAEKIVPFGYLDGVFSLGVQ